MPVAWNESLILRLITFYSKYECLRNPLHPNFKNKLCRYKAYKEIVDSMNICGLTIYDCIKKITYLKAQYCYELSKIRTAISCEKFYKPSASWFPIIHQLFFPFVATYSYASDSYKVHINTFGDYHCNKTHNQLTHSNSVESRVLSKNCNCPNVTCYCDKLNTTKPRTRLKKQEKSFSIRVEDDGVTTLQTTATDCRNYLHPRLQKVIRIDVGNNTNRRINVEDATQTKVSYFKTVCIACQVCMKDNVSVNTANCTTALMKNNLKDTTCTDYALEKGIKGKRKTDEFDMFGKSIAFQLRNINFEIATKLEKRIQDVIAHERLYNVKSKYLECYTPPSCSECEVLNKKMICSCGLPVIMIKTNSSCNFNCK
ncbi:hypothetical protein WN48_11167 [Eufriesea mexicana]|uniref:MADF domain-containing protein n=1 Tax=Eufriesea mexicana TaxID=516756 RepID=A0A310S926_9HYME|nr:hypothetical protein WN48_11167 [Eufriesea mexicana]